MTPHQTDYILSVQHTKAEIISIAIIIIFYTDNGMSPTLCSDDCRVHSVKKKKKD